MVKILIGVLAALVIAAGGYFGFEYYVQQQVASEVEAAFAAVRATGSKASHGRVTFDLLSRTITVADIAGESAAQPPVSVKIGSFTAAGVGQPAAGRFTADRIDAANVEVAGTMAMQGVLRVAYTMPRIEISDYAGPAGPQRQLDASSVADIYRFMLEHFATISAKSVAIPTVTAKMAPAGSAVAVGSGDYSYSGLALRDIKDGKIASTTIDRVTFTAAMNAAGKIENFTGDVANMAAYDFDAAAVLAMLDPARANDDKYYRAYRQMTVGAYTASFEKGMRMRIDGMTADDIGLRPSRLQFPQLMAIVESAPLPGATPTPAQLRNMLDKVAGIYEGVRIGVTEVRGLSMDLPEGAVKLAAIRLANLENGKIAEFTFEGLEVRSPQGPVKIGRFALKALDVANLLRVSAQFSAPGQNPSPDQLVALLVLLEGAEVRDLVTPLKDGGKPINFETFNIAWGQFVGPIPTRARVTVKMTGPADLIDPVPFKMLAAAGMNEATVSIDLGAAWNEGAKSFALEPVTFEVGSLAMASARLALANVPREAFSLNPLQAAIMAAQIEAGSIEITLRDVGGIDLAMTQYARAQDLTRDAVRRTVVDSIRENATKMATVNPDVMAIAGALTRFIENPGGTLTIKLTPRGKVALMQLVDTMRTTPIAALARFRVEATTGR